MYVLKFITFLLNSDRFRRSMNKKIYWKLRKIILTIVFRVKAFFYRIIDFFDGNKAYGFFRRIVIRSSLLGVLKAAIFIVIVLCSDELIFKIKDIPDIDKNIFVPAVIGGISVAGVILGLYCANIASIYSLRYFNAPRIIANAFQSDKLISRCISGIVDYIILGLFIIVVAITRISISWILVIVFILWTINVVVSYSIAGNRSYQLSDIYEVSADSYRVLYRIISKQLSCKFFVSDVNFQNHFLKVAEKQIDLLKSLQRYGARINRNDNADNSTMVEFMGKNLQLLELYWPIKENIGRFSLWFKDTPKYPRWHFTGDIESSIALKTGTSLHTKSEHNYWWFEDEIISINKSCLNRLFEQDDFTSIYLYMSALKEVSPFAIEHKEANFYITHVDWIKQLLEKRMLSDEVKDEDRNAFAGVIEIASLLYLDLILESSKVYQSFDFEKIAAKVIKSIDFGVDAEKNENIRGRQDIDFYNRIITEVKVEGKRITPSWVIKQQIAKEEYLYLNSLLDIVREGINHSFSLGEILLEKELYFEACIIFTRFYEYESKLTSFVSVVESRKAELERLHVDQELKWDEFRLEKLRNTIDRWKKSVPTSLAKCSSHFAVDNWDTRENYPDFLGECYNHICEDAIKAIINDDKKQFEIDFENLSKMMLLYQEYIRTDFTSNQDLYRIEYAYYKFTSPIVKWAQIGGLAILWGEFHSDDGWNSCVRQNSDLIFKMNGELTGLAEKLIKYIQDRSRFMGRIASRDILETEWQQSVTYAIRNSGICEIEHGTYGNELKTSSRLLKAFCPNFIDRGFTKDPSEVFWVICANPLVCDDKKYHTKCSWEDKLNG